MRRSVHVGSRKLFTGLLIGLVLSAGLAALIATRRSSAATPASGTISPDAPTLNYDAGPFLVPNQSPLGLGQLDSGPRCNGTTFPCDNFALTVSLPSGYVAANPNAGVKVTMYWTDTGSKQSDYDLYIYQGVVDTLGGSQAASYSSASGANPEVAIISPLKDGNNQYSVKIVPYVPTAETVHVRLELDSGTGPAGFPGFGLPDPTAPGVARYQIFETPAGSSAEGFQGEMNIGFNPASGRILTMNSGPIWRLTLPERLAAAKPECCAGLWEDVTNLTTITGVDPILWTDQKTGRTFASNSTAGTNGVYGYSDNDGDLWNPLSASPPNASSDHETIGSGPYPASLSVLSNPVNHGQAVYYCAQTYPVGAAACQRSDTLGMSYGPSTLPYTGNNGDPCHGIHGHVHVGPDGTVYLPVRDCGGNAGLAVSTDGGVNWTEHIVPNTRTQTHGSDPSVAIGANNTVYFFYVASNEDNSEGHMHVQVSKDRGATWSKDTDLGASHGIINAVFPEAIAGDDDRAACGFLGTDRPGFYEGPTFPGIWYLFIATTYDGGDTWNVVNATPNDPVQGAAGIWQGGGNQTNRNLLDFNEITMDDRGRVLFGYDDGCVNDCVGDPTHNSYGARIRVARQIGGKGLLSQFDPVEPAAPRRACLSGTRDPLGSHLLWKVPDNSGADITNYQIFRGTTAGSEVLIGQTGTAKPSYDDTSADPAIGHYFYVVKAINSAGEGSQSNEVDLVSTAPPPVEDDCAIPGLTKLTDASGDTSVALGLVSTPAPPGTDLISFQLAQPFSAVGVPKLVFTINTDSGQSPQPPGSSWYVAMKIINGDTTRYAAVHMTWTSTSPTFESYVPDTNNSGGVDGRFIVPGSQKPAEPDSSYAAPFNKVVIVVKASDLGLSPGDAISGFVSGVSQTDPAIGAITPLYDQMPDSLAFANSYTVHDNAACAGASPSPTPTPITTPDACATTALVIPDAANDQSGGAATAQLDITSVSIAENYDYSGFDQLAFGMKVANLNSIPPSAVWRTRFTVGAQAYFVSMNSDSNSVVTFEYGIQNGSTVSTIGAPDFGVYSSDGTIRILLNKRRVGNPTAGTSITAVSGATQVFAGADGTGGFLNLDSTNAADYPMTGLPAGCTQVPRPGTAPANYVKGGIGFSANVPLKAPVAGRDGEPSLRVDKFGNAYVAGIRGVPAGVDLWYFDLQPNSPTYDPLMRNPIYRGQPDQFSPDDSLEVGADGGGDVDLAVGFDESSPGNAPYLAFSSLVAANISTARSSDRGQTFTKNPIGNVTGGAPGDDRQWLEFYGKDKVYLLYRTLAPAVTQIQRSEDGGLTYGPAITAGAIGQVGSIDVDQTDGTIYISGSSGDIAVGIPTAAGLPPLSYTVHHVADGVGNLFFVIKAADDKDAAGNHLGTVYVAYSDGLDIYIKYSKDKGSTWSNAIRVSDGPDAHTNLLPWIETGSTPGSIGVVWYGTSEEFNNDKANWKAFFAQSLTATDPTPSFRQVEISDHVIHGSNISLGGLLGSANRNLLDYFQIAFDPQGAAVVAFTDDHNDFDGHTYVARQIAGPGVNGSNVPAPVEGNALPAPAPTPAANDPQVVDWAQDMRQGGNSQVGGLIVTPINDPVDIISIRYATEPGTDGPVISATMKVSDLSITPPSSTWRMNLTANAPDTRLSPNGLYSFGLSDRGDQFYLKASTDSLGALSYAYGTAQRLSTGGITYTDIGPADAGSVNAAAGTITVKVSASKLNAILSAAGRPAIGPGSTFAGLRGSAFTSAQGNNFKTDSTRGGTLFRIDTPPTAVLTANPASGFSPLNVSLDGSCSTDPDAGDVLTYTFDFGDGSSPITQNDPRASHVYNQVGNYVASLKVRDSSGFDSNTATVSITVNAPPPPISVCYEDDDAHIAYSGGWHLVNSSNASAGHFRLHNGADSTHFASLTIDVPAGQTGTLTYTYAKSTKGGSAEVFIDGVSKGLISFKGLNGGMRDPEFKSGSIAYSVSYGGLSGGQHKFELRNLADTVYIDNICLVSAASSSQPATGPGQTTTNSAAVSAGQQSSSSLSLPANATEVSVLAEAGGGLPIKLLLVDPSGLTLKTVDSTNGVAVLSVPVNKSGLYTVKVVNVSLGPLQVWTAATPTLVR